MTLELRSHAEQDGIDIEGALARIGGYEALLAEPSGGFVEDSREMLRAVRGALERGETAELRAAAHKSKGAIGIFGSTSALRLASDLMAAAARSGRREGPFGLRRS